MSKNKLILISIALLYLVPRLLGIGTDILNTDARRWYDRSQNFLNALKEGNPKETYQHYQPGVTLMWVMSISIQSLFSLQYHILDIPNPFTYQNSEFFPTIHFLNKFILILILFFTFIYILWLLRELFDLKIAYIFGFIFALEPYLVGIDRWVHLTSMEVYFSFAAVLSLILFKKQKRNLLLIISSLFFALSVLSKVTTIALLPVLFYIFIDNEIKNKKTYIYMFLWGGLSVFFMFLLFPALSSDTVFVLKKIYNAVFLAVSNNLRDNLLTPFTKVFFYDLVLLFKMSPLLIFTFFVSIFSWKKIGSLKYFILTLLWYYLFLSFSEQKIDRYALALFPYIVLISTMHLSSVKDALLKVYIGAFMVQALLLFSIVFPVYSSYYNPLFGGTEKALDLGIYDNSGEFIAQSAFYLNEIPGEFTVYIPNGFSSFDYFSKKEYTTSIEVPHKYAIFVHDITRKSVNDYGCLEYVSSWGPKDFPTVYLFKCQ